MIERAVTHGQNPTGMPKAGVRVTPALVGSALAAPNFRVPVALLADSDSSPRRFLGGSARVTEYFL